MLFKKEIRRIGRKKHIDTKDHNEIHYDPHLHPMRQRKERSVGDRWNGRTWLLGFCGRTLQIPPSLLMKLSVERTVLLAFIIAHHPPRVNW